MWNIKFLLISVLAVISSFFVHEFGHWLFGELLGYDMKMTLNTVYPVLRKYDSEADYMLISAVGPIITLLQTIIFFLILNKNRNLYLFPFIFSSFYLALLSGIMNLSKPNDLGRISLYFELGLLTLPIVIVILHTFLLLKVITLNQIKKKMIWITVFYVMLFSSIWILTNQFFKIILI